MRSLAILAKLQVQRTEKAAATLGDAAQPPKPVRPFTVKAPGPSVARPARISSPKMNAPRGTGMLSTPGGMTGSEGGKTTLAFLEEGLSPLLYGAGGAAGGYLAGKHILDPLLRAREANIEQRIRESEQWLGRLKATRKAAPYVAGAVGAILLATIAAKKARADEQAKIQERLLWASPEMAPIREQVAANQEGYPAGLQQPFGQQVIY